MADMDISFSNKFNGYDKDEVDRYIKTLGGAYQTSYDEYTAVCAKYNALLEDYKKLAGEREQSKPSVSVIARILADAEDAAEKIIADAQTEADKINADAKQKLDLANELISQFTKNLQDILHPEKPDPHSAQKPEIPILSPFIPAINTGE